MIKGLGYLKYLKQSLIGFGISCFILLGGSFVNGVGAYTTVGIESSPSAVNSNFDITFLKGGGLLTNYIGQGKGILALDNGVLFWWLPDGLPYFYGPRFQGYFPNYSYCSSMSSGGSYQEPTNCISDSINSDTIPLLKNFFSTVKAGDVVYYNYYNEGGIGNWWNGFKICFNSSQLGHSMCFIVGYNYNGVYEGGLSNSRGYTNLTFANLPYSEIGYAPGQAGYGGGGNIDGGSYTGDLNQMDTGDVVNVSCSKKTALMWYRCNGYKTRMCYSSFNNNDEILYSGYNAQGFALTGISIEDVWFNTAWYRRNGLTGDSMGYKDWFDYWRKSFEVYQRNPQHTNPFYGVPVSLFVLMGNVYSYGSPYTNDSILEFCDLSLYTADYSAQYDGVAKNAVCNMSSIDFLDCQLSNEMNPDGGLPGDGGTDGTVGGIGNSWQGITNRSGFTHKPGYNNNTTGEVATGNDLNTIADGKTFENNFFSLLKESYKYPTSTGNGFLPNYIILALCALVLFRFLSH